MPLFMWKPSYELGVAEIDMQHRRLVGMINELFEAMKVGKGKESLDWTLDHLMDYVQRHFATEEEEMRRAEYPGLETHLQEHLDLTNRVLQLRARRRSREGVAASEVMTFLCDWLREHITGSDKAFGEYLKENR